jgi:uncharacterized damage-inducible protein DinB
MIEVGVLQEPIQPWAHNRVFEAVSRLSQEAFSRDFARSHPSVRDTLTHIVWGEWTWLQRND